MLHTTQFVRNSSSIVSLHPPRRAQSFQDPSFIAPCPLPSSSRFCLPTANVGPTLYFCMPVCLNTAHQPTSKQYWCCCWLLSDSTHHSTTTAAATPPPYCLLPAVPIRCRLCCSSGKAREILPRSCRALRHQISSPSRAIAAANRIASRVGAK